MAELQARPFYVLDRPYVIWGNPNVDANLHFIESLDSDFYHRTANRCAFDVKDDFQIDLDDEDSRKSLSSFIRMLWYNGAETYIMTLGALIQSPHAIDGFFQKCRNEDCREIARYILNGKWPQYNFIPDDLKNLDGIMNIVFQNANWTNSDKTISNFIRVTKDILVRYENDYCRNEYNNIKHGLRVSHGGFEFRMGHESVSGTPSDKMELISRCDDASHFQVASRLNGQNSQQHFYNKECSIGWSFQKTIMQIQLFTCLIDGIVAKIRIFNGIDPSLVKYTRPDSGSDFWKAYEEYEAGYLSNFVIDPQFSVDGKNETAEKMAKRFYASLRVQKNEGAA